ncbi:MAG TPA: hypothetical protein ENF26_02175 [Methanomicrobia archaeon]|nr:hypothetical protein [Methanomicrobia archaeon]HEX58939.1 hypothetical protein [Methanomicrobia archaeon]
MERRFVLAVIIGLLVMVFLGFIPGLGAVLAGLAAALVAGDSISKGAKVGFFVGILAIILMALFGSAIEALRGGFISAVAWLIALVIVILRLLWWLVLLLLTAILCLIGGAIGGYLKKKEII